MDAGLKIELVFKRRIVNDILTTFLPTFLILAIVYATNFFKPFFFEAVVTVNLTALLVLTTLFISVSSSLPPTAYVKMIDVWLIFSQLIPFSEVLLHTFMDCMRNEHERDINHHGRSIKIGDIGSMGAENSHSPTLDMTQTDEAALVDAKIERTLLHMGEFAGQTVPAS